MSNTLISRILNTSILYFISFLIFFISPIKCLGSQQNNSKDAELRAYTQKKLKNTILKKRLDLISPSIHGEIQQYMGNEDLLVKYTTLPYDVNLNINERSPLLDIGYLFILALPIILLLTLKHIWTRVIIMLLLSLFYIISSVTGYSSYKSIPFKDFDKIVLEEASNTSNLISIVKLNILKYANTVGEPLVNCLNKLSGKGDSITYPFVLFLFLSFSFILVTKEKNQDYRKWILPLLTMTYTFFWWILGAGISYYGILFLPLALILIFKYVHFNVLAKKTLKIALHSFVGFWIFLSFIYRFSDYVPAVKGALQAPSIAYGLGKIKKNKVLDLLHPNSKVVLDHFNKDKDAKIYRIGTFLHYFIENNHSRVLVDSNLLHFAKVRSKYIYQGDEALIQAFKRAGYKYILLSFDLGKSETVRDLNTFLVKNPQHFHLIGTDRTMLDSKGQSSYTIFGEKMVEKGSFVAFEII